MLRKFLSAVTFVGMTAIGLSDGTHAGEADVLSATATQTADGRWRIEATVRHADTGWEHYADAFDVLAPGGQVLATRTLYHPHVNEQPFTRSISGVAIPEEVSTIRVRARDSRHGHGGAEVEVRLAR